MQLRHTPAHSCWPSQCWHATDYHSNNLFSYFWYLKYKKYTLIYLLILWHILELSVNFHRYSKQKKKKRTALFLAGKDVFLYWTRSLANLYYWCVCCHGCGKQLFFTDSIKRLLFLVSTHICRTINRYISFLICLFVESEPFQPRKWQKEKKMRGAIHVSRNGQKNSLYWRAGSAVCLICNDKISLMEGRI